MVGFAAEQVSQGVRPLVEAAAVFRSVSNLPLTSSW